MRRSHQILEPQGDSDLQGQGEESWLLRRFIDHAEGFCVRILVGMSQKFQPGSARAGLGRARLPSLLLPGETPVFSWLPFCFWDLSK